MRSFYIRILMLLILTTVYSCEKFDNSFLEEEKDTPPVTLEADYLFFQSFEAYDSILLSLERMDDIQRQEWASGHDFVSANMVYSEVEDQIRKRIDDGNYDLSPIINKYSDILNISDTEMSFKFYPKSLADVLNIHGVVRIGNCLYKFTEDKEYIIVDGDNKKLDLINNSAQKANIDFESQNIHVFDRYVNDSKKSTADFPIEGIHTVGRYRLKYELEKVTYYNYTGFDPYTMQNMYSIGYRFKLYIESQKKTIFWFGYKTTIYVKNQHLIRTLNGDYRDVYYSTTSAYTKNLAVSYLSYNFDFKSPYWYPSDYSEPSLNIILYHSDVHTTLITYADRLILDYP